MATKSSKDVGFLLIGGRSVLGAPLTEISESYERVLEEITGLGKGFDEHGAVGVEKFTLSQQGFYNHGVDQLHEALEAADPQTLLYAPVGDVIGSDCVCLSGVRTTYDKLMARDTLHKARAVYRTGASREPMGNGLILSDLGTARTLAGPANLATVDWGAPVTNGGAAYIGCSALALAGGTSLTVVIRHSTDNFSVDDTVLATFTNITLAPAAERIVLAGTIKRYTRVQYTFNGASGGGRSANFAVGLARDN